jgi:hypothetical protein
MQNNGYERPFIHGDLAILGSTDECAGILNTIADASLNAQSPTYDEELELPLYAHQRASIAAMMRKEHAFRNGNICSDGSQLFSHYAILGDGPSTGKSWTALSYICAAKTQPSPKKATYMYEFNQLNFFSLRSLADQPNERQTNLILVPNSLLGEWKELIKRIDISCLIVQRHNTIQAEGFIESCANVDVVLVPHTLYYAFNDRIRAAHFRFTRAFVDSWPTISLAANRTSIEAEFTWFLTSAWYFLLFNHEPLIHDVEFRNSLLASANDGAKEILRPVLREDGGAEFRASPLDRSLFINYYIQHKDRASLIVRCTDGFIKESIGLDEPAQILYPYSGDTLLSCIVSMSSRAIAEPLASGRMKRIYEMIGARTMTTVQWNCERANILKREVPQDFCPICFDNLQVPALTNCCQNFFCAKCLITATQTRGNQSCPMCRGLLHGSRLIIIDDTPEEEGRHPKKVDVLVRELKRRPSGSNLVYFPMEPLYGQLRTALRTADIDFDVLLGNYTVQKRKLAQFRAGAINTLIVCDRQKLIHEDLSHVSSIFIYPDGITQIEKNRFVYMTQKIGRTKPLEIIEFVPED